MTTEKKVLITGSTDGIGRRAALELAKLGYGILLHGRSSQRLSETRDEILAVVKDAKLWSYQADFFDLEQLRAMAKAVVTEHAQLFSLVNNASVFSPREERNAQGLERTFVVSHLAHFVLSRRLLPLLQSHAKEFGEARLINVSSIAQARHLDLENLQGQKGYDGSEAYARAKLCNILFTLELDTRLGPDKSLTVNALHPGVIDTKLLRTGWNFRGDDLAAGARTEVDAVDNPRWQGQSGLYFRDLEPAKPSRVAADSALRAAFWEASQALCGETFF